RLGQHHRAARGPLAERVMADLQARDGGQALGRQPVGSTSQQQRYGDGKRGRHVSSLLKGVLHAELDDPAVVRYGDGAEGGRPDRAAGLSEADLVEQVERFEAELQRMVLVDLDVLEE